MNDASSFWAVASLTLASIAAINIAVGYGITKMPLPATAKALGGALLFSMSLVYTSFWGITILVDYGQEMEQAKIAECHSMAHQLKDPTMWCKAFPYSEVRRMLSEGAYNDDNDGRRSAS